MEEVITNVTNYITANPAKTGQEIQDAVGHKKHQIKQAIYRLFNDNIISAPTAVFTSTIIRKQYGDIVTISGTGDIIVAPMTIISDQGNTISITDMIISTMVSDGNIRVKIYDDTNGEPSALLGQSNSISATLGNMTIPVSATIPADGKIWVGLETDSEILEIRASVESLGNSKNVEHVYGTGIDPFGSATNGTIVPYVGVKISENRVPRWYNAVYTIV